MASLFTVPRVSASGKKYFDLPGGTKNQEADQTWSFDVCMTNFTAKQKLENVFHRNIT